MSALYTVEEIRKIVERDEGQFLEFKSLWDLSADPPRVLDRREVRDFIAEQVAAFANADGGTLVLGVSDDGEITGHGYPEEAVREFFAVPERRLRPAVRVECQAAEVEGRAVLLISVPNHPEAVMVDGDGFPYRVGDRVVKEPQEVINDRKQAYRRVGFEQRIRAEASVADLDLTLVERFLAGGPLAGRPPEEMLVRYGLLIPDAVKLRVTNAALLLFGRPPISRWHARAGIRFFRVAGTERKHGGDRNVEQLPRLEPPLATMIPEAYRMAQACIRRSEKLHDLFFREMPEYPTFAWQEAIVNAVAHRDYAEAGREIEVWFFEDRMEVWSPGDLLPPVTIDRLRKHDRVHASRNPLMVRVLADAALMREEGEGVPRIFMEMEGSLLNPPRLELDDSTFQVVLLNQPVFDGPAGEWKVMLEGAGLNTHQKMVLMRYPDGFTNEDYRDATSLDRDTAYREIQELLVKGVVRSSGLAGRGARYTLSADWYETRRWLESRMPKLKDYLATHPFLTNGEYRALFEIPRSMALRELNSLVERGFLQREGVRKGTKYFPASPAWR